MQENKPKERNLSDQQKLFLSVLMDEAKGDIKTALRLAGYSPGTRPYDIMKTLKAEIVEVALGHLALHGPKAAHSMTDILENPVQEGVSNKIKAAKEILDRAGASAPKEGISLNVPQSGLILLPPKGQVTISNNDEDDEGDD